MKKALDRMTQWLLKMMKTKWFAIILSICAFLDTFLLVFLIDPLLITATMLRKRMWFFIALTVAAGNVLSVFVFSYLVFNYLEGLTAWVAENFTPEAMQEAQEFSERYGAGAAFLGSLTPIPFQLFLVAGATAKMNSTGLITAIALGRLLKYVLTCALAAYAPDFLKKLVKFRI